MDHIDTISYNQLVQLATLPNAKEYNYVEFSYNSERVRLGSANSLLTFFITQDSTLHFEVSTKIPLGRHYARVRLYTLVLSQKDTDLKADYILFSPFFNAHVSGRIIKEFVDAKPMPVDTEDLSESEVNEVLRTLYDFFLALLSKSESSGLMKEFPIKYPLMTSGVYTQEYNECLQLLSQYNFWETNLR